MPEKVLTLCTASTRHRPGEIRVWGVWAKATVPDIVIEATSARPITDAEAKKWEQLPGVLEVIRNGCEVKIIIDGGLGEDDCQRHYGTRSRAVAPAAVLKKINAMK